MFSVSAVSRTHLDRLHHAFVFVFHHVTMKHKATPTISGLVNGMIIFAAPGFPFLIRRNAEGVAQAVQMRRNAIDLSDQKSGLMDMEIVVLRIFV
jgi:hypothetical protein